MTLDLTAIRFEEIPQLAGVEAVGEWFSVAEERTDQFSVASYNAENEKAFDVSLFPSGMVEGFHLVALLDHLTNAVLRTDASSCTGWNYGLDRVRFITTVRAEDSVRLHLKVADVRPKDDGYVLTFDCTVEHSNSDRPAYIARWLVYWLRAGSQSGSQPASAPAEARG